MKIETINKIKDICIKLGIDIDVNDKPMLKRTRAGKHQMTCGAWSWIMVCKNIEIGSCYTIDECIKAFKENKLVVYDDFDYSNSVELISERKKL